MSNTTIRAQLMFVCSRSPFAAHHVQGGGMIKITFGQSLPLAGDIVLVFVGTGNPLEVPAERLNHCTVTAIIPGTVRVGSHHTRYS